MKFNYIFSLMFLLAMVAACENEEQLTPRSSDASSTIRFEFPQGDHPWDKDLEEIANTFKTTPIYTGFDSLDLNRQWTGGAAIKYVGRPLSDEYVPFYTAFIKNHVFAFLKPELLKGVLPNYIYLVDEFRMRSNGDYATDCYWKGLDFWGFCLHVKDSSLYKHPSYPPYFFTAPIHLPSTPWEYKFRRGIILHNIIQMVVEKGNLVIPAEFEAGEDFDYSKSITTNPTDENYYVTRGFPGQMSTKLYNFSNWGSINLVNSQTNFISYLKLGLRYTRDSVLIQYPKEKFPKIIKYYDFTMKYMKDKYDWDIAKMAELSVIKED